MFLGQCLCIDAVCSIVKILHIQKLFIRTGQYYGFHALTQNTVEAILLLLVLLFLNETENKEN